MEKIIVRTKLALIITIGLYMKANSQLYVSIPWSSSLNINFNSPLSPSNSDFVYTPSPSPPGGYYTIVPSNNDAGHVYMGPFTMSQYPPDGFKMEVTYMPSQVTMDIFRDTVRNLCGNSKYLFWAGINNMFSSGCYKPVLSFRVESLSGNLIADFQTGQIDGPLSQDHYSWYPGFYDPTKKPKVPFYGGVFQLPAGVTDVVVKISTVSAPPGACPAILQLDNILMTPIGPDVKIKSHKYPGGWIAASCFEGNVPLELFGEIEPGYLNFGTGNIIQDAYTNPAYQWQQSLDDGYTWTDIPGENSINISHNFNLPDTFWMRLGVAESGNISNPNCRNVSNVMRIVVDGLPTDFSMTSNSPVCTDGDLKLVLTGGVTYDTYGPNGFYDDSPYPHIYHPQLRDSGLYYAEIKSLGGCIGRDSVYVQVIGPAITNVSGDRSICWGDTVHLFAEGGVKYNWTPSKGLNNTNVANPVANPLTTTTYQVQVTDNHGCNDYKHVTVTLRDSVLKAFFTGPAVACPGDMVLFSDTSVGQITNYHWDLGNGNTADTRIVPLQVYPIENGVYIPISLTVTDTAGCVKTYIQNIRSVNNCYIAVPSAFTPNNDGLNDYLYPLNAYKATNLTFQVYDRWGQKLFETHDWTQKWDGTVHGTPQAAGVYIWMLSYTDENKRKIFLKGTTALIR